MTETSLRRAGLILISTTVLGKLVGFLREAVIASTYGTSQVVDVYLAAMTLPAMAATIVFHSVPNAFVPLFSVHHGYVQARRQAWGLLGVMCLLSAAVWSLAGPVATLTNAGFPSAMRAETIVVLRITSVAIALATMEALSRSRLLAQKRFGRAGLSLIWQSVVMIVAVWSYPSAGPRTLAWGFVAGAAASVLWNLLPGGAARKDDAPAQNSAMQSRPWTGTGLWVPIILLADSIPQLYTLVDRHLGSFLTVGSIAALQYANLIALLPISMCGLALGTAILPYLSASASANDSDRTGDILDKAVRWSLIAAIPATIWLTFFGQEVTALLYERGAFNQSSRILTASTLSVYSLGLVPNVLVAILAKVFYSSRRWRPVMLASVVSVALKWALSQWWVGEFGTLGLASASVAGSTGGAACFLVALPRGLLATRWSRWALDAAALGGICTVASLLTIGIVRWLPIESLFYSALLKLASCVLISAFIAYWAASRVGLQEIASWGQRIRALGARR